MLTTKIKNKIQI